jgi:hypothetical protein
MQGSLLLSKARGNASVIKDNVEHFRQYLRFLFGTSESARSRLDKARSVKK